MIRLIVLVLVVAGAWMTWWAIGSTAHQRAVAAWIDERRAEGWLAEVGAVDVAGFPNRFDTTLTDVELANPEAGLLWTAPFVQFLSLAYNPTEVIAVLPNTHRLSTPHEVVDIGHTSARASVNLDALPSLPLDRSTVVVNGLTLNAESGWMADLRELRLAIERREPGEAAARYRIGAAAYGFEFLKPGSEGADALIDALQIDGSIELTEPLDRRTLEEIPPRLTRLVLDDVSGRWGDLAVEATGDLRLDARGIPEGVITLAGADWRAVLEGLFSLGLFPGDTAETLFGTFTALGGSIVGFDLGDEAEVRLSFRGGTIWLGPVPLGPAPSLLIR